MHEELSLDWVEINNRSVVKLLAQVSMFSYTELQLLQVDVQVRHVPVSRLNSSKSTGIKKN